MARPLVAFALLVTGLTACMRPDGKVQVDQPPEGMHILADGALEAARPDQTTLRVSYHANLLNGGTEACQSFGFRRRWPEELARLVVSETTYGGGSGPARMRLGDRSRPEGVAVLDIKDTDPMEIDRLLASFTMEATCDEPEQYKGYRNVFFPVVIIK